MKRKILIVFDDMIVNKVIDKTLISIVTTFSIEN